MTPPAPVVPQSDRESVYGSTVVEPESFARARAGIKKDARLQDEAKQSKRTRNDLIRAAYDEAPVHMSDNAFARALGLDPSTFRSIVPLEQREQRARTRTE